MATPWRVCSSDSAARTRQRVLRALPATAVRYVASAVRLCSTAACTWVQARPPPPQATRRADVRTCLRGCTRPYSRFTAWPGASLRRRVGAACACAWRRVRLGGIGHSRRRWRGHATTHAATRARALLGASDAVLTRWQLVGARINSELCGGQCRVQSSEFIRAKTQAAVSAARSDRGVTLPRCGVAAGARVRTAEAT